MHLSHGRYYLVRGNKWTPLSRDLHDALIEYARLTVGKSNNQELADLVERTLGDMKATVAASTFKNYKSCSRKVLKAFSQFTGQAKAHSRLSRSPPITPQHGEFAAVIPEGHVPASCSLGNRRIQPSSRY